MNVLFIISLIVRLSSVLVIQTSYVPDETWQCTEVAHMLVFGNGHLTWEWKEGLRSYLHPLLFAIPLQILKILRLDTNYLVIHLPRVLQAIMCCAGDMLMYRLVVRLYGHTQAMYTVILQLTSWYLYYVTPRPLINNLETLLITATLNLWPTRYHDVVTYPAVVLAALSVAIRPTLVLFWVVLGVHYLWKCPERRLSSVLKAAIIGIPTLLATVLLDTHIYGKPVFVFYNFLDFNLRSSAVYGAHPWHWYITQGIPALLGTHAIFIVIAFIKQRDYPRQFMGVVIATVFMFSCISHKEFRFIQHLMPIFMLWAGLGLHWISRHVQASSLYFLIMLHSLLNIIAAFYLGFIHQRGTISVIQHLSQHVNTGDSILFLTPCHATPLHSHLHRDDVITRFLDCSPDLQGVQDYEHEEARFYRDPVAWWDQNHKPVSGVEYVVIFEESLEILHERLKRDGFTVKKRYFHAHVLVDDKLAPHLLLYKNTA